MKYLNSKLIYGVCIAGSMFITSSSSDCIASRIYGTALSFTNGITTIVINHDDERLIERQGSKE